MIETKEQYERVRNESGYGILGVLELRVGDLIETIEALRKVARAAAREHGGHLLCQDRRVHDALDNLAPWLLEE